MTYLYLYLYLYRRITSSLYFGSLGGGRNKIGMAIHLHKAEYFYYT